jgi:integrase
MAKVFLTDRFIKSPKRIPTAKPRYDWPDSQVPGLALRCTAQGHRSFVLIARFPLHPQNPTRRRLGDVGEITLEEAREKAREWLALVRKGIDPSVEEVRKRAENQRSQINSFAAVAEEFLARHGAKLAHSAEARRIIEAEFVKRWAIRPAGEIEPAEVAAVIRIIAKRSEAQAHNSFGHLRRLYSWAIASGEFGLDRSPCERLKPADLIGKRVARERVLTGAELLSVWNAAGRIGYPSGAIVKMLILTGQRLNEIAALSWSEIDLTQRLISIPAARMKQSRAHEIPLAPLALELLRDLPRFTRGDYTFTATGGARPFVGFGKAKRRLDDLSGVKDWVLHDLRRTARTHWSALPVPDMIKELMLAHARPGLHAVYDQFAYRSEKAELLRLWELRLHGVLNPTPARVTDIDVARARRA